MTAPPAPSARVAGLYRVPEPGAADAAFVHLHRNERLQPLPAWYLAELRARVDSDLLTGYPVADELLAALSRQLGLPVEQLLLAPGSDGAMKGIFQAYLEPGDRYLTLDPSYAMYAVYGEMFGGVHEVIAFAADGSLSPEALADAVRGPLRLVVIANPNQPTGTVLSLDAVECLAGRAALAGALLVVDEAYHPFADVTAMPLVARLPNLVVTRTFSKAAGLAGLRIGYVAAHPDVIASLFKVRSVHDVNAVAMVAAQIAVERPEVIADYVAEVRAGAALLAERARGLGLEPRPVTTNFMLLPVGQRCPPGELIGRLRERGYLVRGPFSAPALADCVRVTLGPPALMARFADALADAIAGPAA